MAITLINEKTKETMLLEESGVDRALNDTMSIIEYVETEMATFARKPFTAVDSLVLAQVSYMNFGGVVPGVVQGAEGVPLQSLYRAECFEEYTGATLMPEKNRQLLNALCASPRFRDIKLNYFVENIDCEKEQQFCAMSFFLPCGQVYVCFRGTDTTINGWKEDFNMFFLDIIPGQIAAAEYLETVASFTDRDIYVGGHSKGGNLAMYAGSFATPAIQGRILQVFNHDGPGLTKGAMAKPEYTDIAGKMSITLPRSSVIGLIFCHGNYKVIKSDRIGIMQHDPFSWEIEGDDFIYYRRVKPGANKLIDAVYELMETLDEKDRQLFIDTVFDIIYSAGATTFSEFPVMAVHSRDKIMETLKSIDPQTGEKVKSVISELIKIVARKSFRIPENEVSGRLNEKLAKISATTDRIGEKVSETTDLISGKVNEITGRVTEATVLISETKDRLSDKITETSVKITDTIEKAKQLLKKEEQENNNPEIPQ